MPPTATPPPRAVLRGPNALRWGLPLLALLVIAGMWMAVLGSLATERERIEQDALARAAGLARGYAEHTERTIGQIDQLTRFVAYRHLREGMNADMADLVRQQLAIQPGLLVLSVSDRNGALTASSQREFTGGDIGDRPYFQRHANDASQEMLLSEPVMGKLSKKFVVVLSRRLDDARGEFAGVVAVSAEPSYFAGFYSPDAFGRHGTLALMSPDGSVRVQRFGDEIRFQGRMPAPPALRIAPARADASSVRDSDGRQRYYAYRELENYPLHVAIGLDQDEVLASHRQRRSALYLLFALASVLLAGAFGVLGMLTTRLRHSQAKAQTAHRQFDAASDASLDAFFIFTAVRDTHGGVVDFRYVHCNARGAELLGLPKQDVVGHTRTEALPAGGDRRLFELYAAVLHTGEARQGEFESDIDRRATRMLQHQVVAVGDGVAVTTRDMTAVRAQERAVQEAQDALRTSEQRIRTVTDNLPALISYVDADQRYHFINRHIQRDMGVAPEQIVGRTMAEVLTPSVYAQVEPFVALALAGDAVSFENVAKVHGERRHYTSKFVADRASADGAVRGFYALTLDITERRRAEEALMQSEQNLRALTDHLPALVARVDQDGCYTYANQRLAASLGFEVPELIGRPVRDVIGEAAFSTVDAPLRTALGGAPVAFPRDITGPDGALRNLYSQYVPDRRPDGSVAGVYAVSLDVTELAQARQRIAAQERQLRAITDNLPAMVSHVDAAGRYTFVNALIARKFGVPAHAIEGRTVREVRGEADHHVLAPYVARVMAGESVSFEKPGSVERADSASFYQADLVPDHDENGVVRGYYAMTFDITALKQSELRLAASEARIRAIADNIPAYISHVDEKLRYTFVNANVNQPHKNAPQIGASMRDVRGEAEFATIAPYIQRVLAGEAVTFEKDGDAGRGQGGRVFEVNYVPDIDGNGRVQGFYGLTFDMTVRKRAEQAAAASQAQLHRVLDNVPATIAYFDRDERCLFANDRVLRMVGIQRGQEVGYTLRTGMGDALYAQHQPHVAGVLAGQSARYPVTSQLDGRDLFFQGHLVPDLGTDGSVTGFYLLTFNVTALKEAELRQAESEKRLHSITDNIPALVSYINREQRLTFANAAFRGAVQKDAPAILGRHVREVVGDALYLSRQPMIERALAGERVEFDREGAHKGALRATHTVYVPDTLDNGDTQGIFALSFDITALKSIERRLLELARADTLTGLPNRLAFNETLPAALARARRSNATVALMFLDIDHFKTINDTLGHAAGDLVLTEFARRLRDGVRTTDSVARLAGDEFVVVLEHLDNREAAAAVAEKIIAQVQHPPFQIDGRTLQVTTSIGIACQSSDLAPIAAADLLARADAALYGAKAAGRNTFEFFRAPVTPDPAGPK